MSKKLKGTSENFMHAAYLAKQVCAIDAELEGVIRDDLCGEDSLMQEVIPYGLMLGKAIDAVWEEAEQFPGVAAYEISDDMAAVWLHKYVMAHDYNWPEIEDWGMFCLNLLRAWCKGQLDAFIDLPYGWQMEDDKEKVGIVQLWEAAVTPAKEEVPRLPNGQAINVGNVEKLIEGTGITFDRAIATLSRMPSGTHYVAFNTNTAAFWREQKGDLFFYGSDAVSFSDVETGSWVYAVGRPEGLIEYEKVVCPFVFEHQKLEQDVAIALESEEIQPDREIKESVVTEVRSAVQYFGLEIVSEGNKITVTQGDFEVVLIDGKFTKVGDTVIPV